MGREAPASLVFVFCERVEQDDRTGQFSLINLLDGRQVSRVPAISPGFVVYVELAGDRGIVDLALRLVQLVTPAGGPSAGEFAVALKAWKYPTAVLRRSAQVGRICFQLGNISFPEAGSYLFGLYADGQLIASRRFSVTLIGDST